MWALGKIYQRLNDHSSALTWFSKAHKVDANNAAILREATISAMRLGNGVAAVEMALSAVKLEPHDVGLVSNLALALLIDGKTEEAREMVANAVRGNRDDRVARAVQQLIDDVIGGKTPRPRTLA